MGEGWVFAPGGGRGVIIRNTDDDSEKGAKPKKGLGTDF